VCVRERERERKRETETENVTGVAGALPPYLWLQSALLWLFWRWASHELLAEAGFEL
jgi:hypothetical protein